jgi:glycerol-3-phosphate dehydrogenase subunit C
VTDLVRASLDHCVKCTICETYCPVSNVTPLFPGPKFVGPQADRFRDGSRSPDHSLDYCSGCGICTQVCPQGVKIAEINARARAELKAEHGLPLRDRLIARPSLLGSLGQRVAPLANRALRSPMLRRVVERSLGIHRNAPLPAFASRSFQSWAKRRVPLAAERSVVYFHGCSTNFYEPQLGQKAVSVLEHNGYRVLVPRQGCCGLPLQSNGAFEDARRYVRALVAQLAPLARAGHTIVATSTSCGLMLKREAHEILGVDDDDLHVVASQTYDICEFLLVLWDRGELRTDLRPVPSTIAYHAPCQLRGHGVGKPALDLMALIPQLDVVELDRECCGIAGTYGIKQEKYDIAMDVGAPLFADVRSTGPDAVACDSETCRWQIAHGSGTRAVHPIELLHAAYGLGGPA